MSHAYTEDQLVEQPAIQIFSTMGWRTVSAADETRGAPNTESLRDRRCAGRSGGRAGA
jgi:type I restriction enzyme R subunit